ncbi:MAG: hypothetical protein KBC33_00330 [Candidatus Pacebacteria bacterium]|nr:hypothetical protein [Candidatus Paceibacterota bacterium]
MKKKLLVVAGLVAIVAIFSPQNMVQAQDATQEQKDADALRVQQADYQARLSIALAQEALKKLTPEQIEKRKEAIKRALAMPRPPLPTNSPSLKTIRQPMVVDTKKSTTPGLTQSERLQFRNMLITEIMMGGLVGTQESADYINQSIAMLNAESAEPETIIESAYALAAIVGSGGIEEQGLMSAARTVDYTSNPYVPINTFPFEATSIAPWYTSSSSPFQPWSTVPRTLVSSNGPAAKSYVFPTSVNGASYIRALINNHYDQVGKPVRHILAFHYVFTNVHIEPVTGLKDFAFFDVNMGTFNGSTYPVINHATDGLEQTFTGYSRPVYLINAMPKKVNPGQIGVLYYELLFQVTKQNLSGRPSYSNPTMTLDPSVQWIPYWLSPINGDLISERVGNQIWVQWNTIAYPTNSFKLAFTTSLANTNWSTTIGVPVTYTNEVATAKFSPTNPMRLYRLQNY